MNATLHNGLVGHTVTNVVDNNTEYLLLFGGLERNYDCILDYGQKLSDRVYKITDEDRSEPLHVKNLLITPRNFHSSVLYNNSLYIFGGKSNGYRNDLFSFNITTAEWKQVIYEYSSENVPTPRYGHAALVANNIMFVFGGYDNNGQTDKSLYRYSFEQSKWLPPVKLPITSRYHHTMTLKDDKILIFGGCSESKVVYNDLFAVGVDDLLCQTLAQKTNIKARFGHVAWIENGEFHVHGGCDFAIDFPLGEGDSYNFQTMEWTRRTKYTERGPVFATASHLNGNILFLGGTGRNVQQYEPVIDKKRSIELKAALEQLPQDIVLNILHYCDLKTWTSLRRASNKWTVSKLSETNLLWKKSYNWACEKVQYKEYVTKHEKELEKLLQDKENQHGNGYKRALIYLLEKTILVNTEPQYDPNMNRFFEQARKEMVRTPPREHAWDLSNNYDSGNLQHIKVVVIGDGATGKTSLLIRATSNRFPDEYIPTVFDTYAKQVTFKANKKSICIDLWDTAGGEDYDRLRPLSYPGTDIFLICFNPIRSCSFTNIRNRWEPEIRHHAPKSKFILVANKIDLTTNPQIIQQNHERGDFIVTPQQMDTFAKQVGALGFIETSALTGYGADELCYFIASLYLDKKEKKKKCKTQ